MEHHDTCIFCDIVDGLDQCHLVAEDDLHLAFLDIFPNTLGATVVIPKAHHSGDYTCMTPMTRAKLAEFTAGVMRQLRDFFPDVGRVAQIVEGYGIQHYHVKLCPMHDTPKEEPDGAGWRRILSPPHMQTFYYSYPGYLVSASGPPADSDRLAKLAKALRGE